MPQVDIATIAKAVEVAKPFGDAMGGIAAAPTDWLGSIERIMKLIEKGMAFSQATRPAQPPAPQDAPPPPNSYAPPFGVQALPIAPTIQASVKDTRMSDTIDFIIKNLEPILDARIKENANMPIGEFIARIDILTVSDLKALLGMYRLKRASGK
jgi:hypothetical protein